MSDVETVIISLEEYAQLREYREELFALHEAGVDNWEGYGYAMELLEGDEFDCE